MDAARTAKRLGGLVTIVYRRTQAEMPARVEELHHALEEKIELMVLRSPREFTSEKSAHVCHAILDVMELGPPDASGRRAPVVTGKTEAMPVDLVIGATPAKFMQPVVNQRDTMALTNYLQQRYWSGS